MPSNLKSALLAFLSLGLQAQSVGGVEIQRLDGGKSVVLPAPSPAFMDAVLSNLVGEVPPIGPTSERDDPASDVEWTVRGSLSPAFSVDTTFTFVAYRDGHRTLTVTRPMIVNAWYQMQGAPCLFAPQSTPETIAPKLLSHRWSFSSREHPELLALMDEVKSLPGYKLFPIEKGKDSPQVAIMDGPSFAFDLTTGMGHLQLGGFPTFEANALDTKVFGWIDHCVTWIESKVESTKAQDLKAASRRWIRIVSAR